MRVNLSGEIVADEWQWLYDWYGIPAFSPQLMRQALKDNPEGEALTVEINSGGGSVFAGFEIYSVLRAAKCHTVAEVQSIAASAASTAMVGCASVQLSPVAQVMLHLPSASTEGDVVQHERSLRALESIKQSILNGYEVKSRGKAQRATLEQLMDQETWLDAQQAVELGLADGILYAEDFSLVPANVRNAVGGGIRTMASAAGQHDPQAMLARYEQAVRDGAAPAAGHPVTSAPAGEAPANDTEDWQRRARLSLEKNRF